MHGIDRFIFCPAEPCVILCESPLSALPTTGQKPGPALSELGGAEWLSRHARRHLIFRGRKKLSALCGRRSTPRARSAIHITPLALRTPRFTSPADPADNPRKQTMAAPSPAVAAVSSSAPSSGLLPPRRAAPCSAVQLPSFRRAAPGGRMTVARAVGDVAAEGNTYLIAGAVAVALVGTAFPIFFSRKDTCPECDGAGFVRKSGSTLRANAARKDQAQIVCANCNGLGKLGQIDK